VLKELIGIKILPPKPKNHLLLLLHLPTLVNANQRHIETSQWCTTKSTIVLTEN
jgi:hypothetical protein